MSQQVSVMQPASTLQVASTTQLAIDAQISSFWLKSIGLGAGVGSFSAPKWNWPGFGAGAASYRVPSYSSLGVVAGATSSGLLTTTTSATGNSVTGTSLPTQVTPAAHPVVVSCRVSFGSRAVRPGLQNISLATSPPASPSRASSPASSSPSIPSSASSRASSVMGMSLSHGMHSPGSIISPSIFQPLSPSAQHTPVAPLIPTLRGLLQPATPATTQQSQSTAVGAPQSSMALMRSASSKHRSLSQPSQSHQLCSTVANVITISDSSDDDNGGASIPKVNNKEIVSFYLLLFTYMYMDV